MKSMHGPPHPSKRLYSQGNDFNYIRQVARSLRPAHSTVTLFARFLGWSTSVPFSIAT